jgi:acyl carrier protein
VTSIRPAKQAAEDVRAETEAVVRAMAKVDPGPLHGDMRLVADLGFDSLRLIELAIAVEQRLGLAPVDLESAVSVVTVEDVTRLVLSAQAAQAR